MWQKRRGRGVKEVIQKGVQETIQESIDPLAFRGEVGTEAFFPPFSYTKPLPWTLCQSCSLVFTVLPFSAVDVDNTKTVLPSIYSTAPTEAVSGEMTTSLVVLDILHCKILARRRRLPTIYRICNSVNLKWVKQVNHSLPDPPSPSSSHLRGLAVRGNTLCKAVEGKGL